MELDNYQVVPSIINFAIKSSDKSKINLQTANLLRQKFASNIN